MLKSLLHAALCVALMDVVPTMGFGIGSGNLPALRSGALNHFSAATIPSRRSQGSCIVMNTKKPPKSDKMQVLLKSNIEGVGKANQVVQVCACIWNGNNYAREAEALAWGIGGYVADEPIHCRCIPVQE
jgi:hypothetical protein